MDTPLGDRELDVLAVLWTHGPATVAEAQERLAADLAYNTVLTVLRNLESKGVVGHTAEGRTFRYHPLVSEQTVRGSALGRLVDKLFRGSGLRVVAQLVEEQSLTQGELVELQRLLATRLDASPYRPSDGPPSTSPHDGASA